MLLRDLQNVLMVSSNVKKVGRQNVAPFINLPQCMPFCSSDRPICDVLCARTHTHTHTHMYRYMHTCTIMVWSKLVR